MRPAQGGSRNHTVGLDLEAPVNSTNITPAEDRARLRAYGRPRGVSVQPRTVQGWV